MATFYDAYLKNLEELHLDIRAALQNLPQSALDWSPAGETNSINVLVTHLAGAERYWIGDVVMGADSGRDREAEFKTSGLDVADLEKRLDAALEYARTALAKLTLSDLETLRISPRNGREVSVAWALGHALKHTALHLGHIQLTRQMWEKLDSHS